LLKLPPLENNSPTNDTTFLKFISGKNSEGKKAKQLRENIERVIGKSLEQKLHLFDGLTEAFTNTTQHAYDKDNSKEFDKWWNNCFNPFPRFSSSVLVLVFLFLKLVSMAILINLLCFVRFLSSNQIHALMLVAELDVWNIKSSNRLSSNHKTWHADIKSLLSEMGLFELLRACNDKLVFFFILSLSLLKNYFRKISVIYKIHHYREKYFQRIG
jgi:hypothetical protein